MKPLFPLSICALILLGFSTAIRAQKSGATMPILDVKSGYLLGGSRNGKWLDAKTMARAWKSGATYRVFSVTRALGNGKATAPKSQGAPCPDTLFTQISPDFLYQKAEFALGGASNPLRRAVQVQNVNQAVYRAEIAKILRAKGIAKPIVQIAQIWRVDLDGDGIQEALLTATRKADGGDPQSIAPASRSGDYSLILLRKIVGGKAKNILLEGEFYPRAKTFNAPAFYRLAAVFDANGDGKMEILVRGRYYEGGWSVLYSAQGEPILNEGCGA